MKTDALRRFLSTNAIDYDSLPYSGENEIERDASHKSKWLRQGKAALKELATNLDAEAILNTNPSGSIDRGYVSGFLVKNGRVAYISLNDGMQDILFRTAQHTHDYTGGSNNTESLNGAGFDRLTLWLKDYLQ